jgi:hypothetical protein
LDKRFSARIENDIELWEGAPDCQAAHDAVLEQLFKYCKNFLVAGESVSERHKGNLAEFIACMLGKHHDLSAYCVFAANAFNPLSNISKSDLDLVWVLFGNVPSDDALVLQEVKATGSSDLAIAYKIPDDYQKLFGSKPNFTLSTRLQAIKNQLEIGQDRKDLSLRINAFLCKSPTTARSTTLLPTLVHEKVGADPVTRLLAVRTNLQNKGWSGDSIRSWSVSFTDLEKRFERLAHGQE